MWRQAKRAALPQEPGVGGAVVTCVLRFPDGSRAQRRFRISDALQTLFDFTDAMVRRVLRALWQYDFSLCTRDSMPMVMSASEWQSPLLPFVSPFVWAGGFRSLLNPPGLG